VPGVPELTEGRRLFESQGCRGCHKLSGVGGSIGPDLTAEGANHRAPGWLEQHFLTPNAVSIGSAMPNFHFTREQAARSHITCSRLPAKRWQLLFQRAGDPGPEYGRQLFDEKTASLATTSAASAQKTGRTDECHRRHSLAWLDEQLVNPELVYPGSSMPAYDLEPNAARHWSPTLASPRRQISNCFSHTRSSADARGCCHRSRQAGLRPVWLRRLPRH